MIFFIFYIIHTHTHYPKYRSSKKQDFSLGKARLSFVLPQTDFEIEMDSKDDLKSSKDSVSDNISLGQMLLKDQQKAEEENRKIYQQYIDMSNINANLQREKTVSELELAMEKANRRYYDTEESNEKDESSASSSSSSFSSNRNRYQIRNRIKREFVINQGTNLARSLSSLPPNILTPATYISSIQAIAKTFNCVYSEWTPDALKALGCGAFYAVTQVSNLAQLGDLILFLININYIIYNITFM